MKGDFTRLTYDPAKRFTRVLKQQGRVDLDADWNELVEIFTQLERTEAIDVIGACGVPLASNGFEVAPALDGSDLTVTPGRIYVQGILCTNEADAPVGLTEQADLPGYSLPDSDGNYLVYIDVWERHVTYVEDSDIREVALGGPDTTTRTQVVWQARAVPIAGTTPFDELECQPYSPIANTGRLEARTDPEEEPSDPCVVPAGAGYRGLENRLYRIEIHDDGRDADGVQVRVPTFKWSRDNGSVLLPIADGGIGGGGTEVTVADLGRDDVLTVRVGDWVEVLGDETELNGTAGTLGQVAPDGIDRANREITLTQSVSAHAAESHLKLRRWDHHATDDVALDGGALPIQADWFELEDGVQVRFDTAATYEVGDYWLIPARTRVGTILWPEDGTVPAALPRLGIQHHYCTLALARRSGGVWVEARDCRSTFRPLTEIRAGGCCVTVEPGDDVQQAIDAVIGAGGGCVKLCPGVHEVNGPLRIRNAADIELGGENAASVLRFNGVDALGRGGLMIERSDRVTVHDLFMSAADVPALITVRHDEQETLSRGLALRDLTLLNLTPADPESDLPCAVRLAHAEGVTIDGCRIAAEAGIVSLWGNELPDLAALTDTASSASSGLSASSATSADVLTIGFETLPAATELRVGDSVAVAGITVTAEAFVSANGQTTTSGFARIDDRQIAGGTGQDLAVSSVNLDFGIDGSFDAAAVSFASLGGNTNLRINGDLRNVSDIFSLDGATIGGVTVSVTPVGTAGQGRLGLATGSAQISELVIGGQELWIDNVVFRGAAQPGAPVWRYGDGVSGLRMRETIIRYAEYGVLAARAERWRIGECDIQRFDDGAWSAAAAALPALGAGLAAYTSTLRALDDVLHATAAAASGTAVAAFLWADSVVEGTRLQGFEGMRVFWWIRGALRRSALSATDVGVFAFWLHDAALSHNRIECAEGAGLGFTGSYRARVENNSIEGLLGLSTVGFNAGLGSLAGLGNGLLRGYGRGSSNTASFAALWVLTEESVDLMGLRHLVDALQDSLDVADDTPITLSIAMILANLVDAQQGEGSPLALIDLRVVENRFACEQRCVSIEDYYPLGSLRIADNTVHTLTGQAIRVIATRFFANAHLLVFFYRATLAALSRTLDDALEDADGANAAILTAVKNLVSSWQAGSEGFLELDFRIEGNSVRSLRTAIETNLFETAILNNHITMQERAMTRPVTVGTIFGKVLDTSGAALPGAVVRVAGTQRAATTDLDGSYRITAIEAGTYTLQAGLAGFVRTTAQVSVQAGGQVEADLVLRRQHFVGALFNAAPRQPLSNATLARAADFSSAVSNAEIAQAITALEQSTAFEPLAAVLREGGHTNPDNYGAYLLSADGPLSTALGRMSAAGSASAIRGLTSDADLEQVSGELNGALRRNDRTAMSALLPRFIAALLHYVDSLGILVRGVGCRVVENQVLVPADTDPDTQALGGIQISVNLLDIWVFVLLGNAIMKLLGQSDDSEDAISDPLLNITETLIDNNEVTGGIGHGISVQGAAGQPDYVQDLRIRGNQLLGLAGAGVFCNGHAFIVGLDVDGNQISGCGRATGFTEEKGGIVIETAAVCGIRNNRVVRCGEDQSVSDVFGVDLDTIYGVKFAGNELYANGSDAAGADDGGLKLTEVYGNVTVHDNVFSFNRGSGLSWTNAARTNEVALLPEFLLVAVNQYLRTSRKAGDLVQEEQASIQDNVFKTTDTADMPAFRLLNLTSVNFSGNSCLARTSGAPLGEIQLVQRGVIANNQLETSADVAIAVKKLASGVIIGNVGNAPIDVNHSGSVQSGFNVPAVT